MYIFHLANNKLIKLENSHVLCQWSRAINNKPNDIYLKQTTSDELKMLIRIMELITKTKSEADFIRKIKILSQLSNKEILKNVLLLMYTLEIVPPYNFKVISHVPARGFLADVLYPIVAEPFKTQKANFGDNTLSTNETLSLMLYNQNSKSSTKHV
jgi:hypothetical protein